MPMTVTVLRSWDMACSLSGCLWPAYRWLGREHGRTIPLPEVQLCCAVDNRLINWRDAR